MYTTLIDCDSLLKEIDNPNWLVFDTRYDLMAKEVGKAAYVQGHIPGAIYLDLHDHLSGPPITNRGRHPLPTSDAMNTLFSEQGINSNSQVVVYDDAYGSFAARLWWMLQHMQHPKVAVLDGGWQAWLDNEYPVNTHVRELSSSEFAKSAKEDVVTIDEVESFKCVVDSRDPARYRGEIEPIDKAAGHIPDALNRFWKDNLSESGKFKEKHLLKQEFERVFKEISASEAVFYCGSGVTACHNLLAAAHAGLETPKLYAGSWSEWSSTPGRPIATGA